MYANSTMFLELLQIKLNKTWCKLMSPITIIQNYYNKISNANPFNILWIKLNNQWKMDIAIIHK